MLYLDVVVVMVGEVEVEVDFDETLSSCKIYLGGRNSSSGIGKTPSGKGY